MNKRACVGALAGVLVLVFGACAVEASFLEVTVQSTAGPWNWATGGLNSTFNYGPVAQDFTAPTTINLSAALGLNPGDALFIQYKSGLTSAFGGPPIVGPTGYTGTLIKDDAPGSSGQPFPSNSMPSYWGANSLDPGNANLYGVFLQALVGAITDSSGAVLFPFPVGYVFPVDNGFGGFAQAFGDNISMAISTSGAFLQLGFNDDIFSDNTGSMQVCVGSSRAEVEACVAGVAAVPEPGTLVLIAAGLLGLGVLHRRRTTVA